MLPEWRFEPVTSWIAIWHATRPCWALTLSDSRYWIKAHLWFIKAYKIVCRTGRGLTCHTIVALKSASIKCQHETYFLKQIRLEKANKSVTILMSVAFVNGTVRVKEMQNEGWLSEKICVRHMQTAKGQTRLRFCAVLSSLRLYFAWNI